MEMVPLDDLLTEVLTYAPNCADPLAMRYLREAASDMCVAGRMWREWDEIAVSTPECEGVSTIMDASIIGIEKAKLGDYELDPVTIGWLDRNVDDWSASASEDGQARYITQLTSNTVTIVPKATGTLKVRLILKPSRTATMIPAWFVDQHATEVGKGAAGRILILPDEAVSNPQLGVGLVNEFNSLLGALKRQSAKGQQGAPLRTRPHFF